MNATCWLMYYFFLNCLITQEYLCLLYFHVTYQLVQVPLRLQSILVLTLRGAPFSTRYLASTLFFTIQGRHLSGFKLHSERASPTDSHQELLFHRIQLAHSVTAARPYACRQSLQRLADPSLQSCSANQVSGTNLS